MELFWNGLKVAGELVLAGDELVLGAAWRTIWISTLAVSCAALIGIPLGVLVASTSFPGRGALILIARALMAVPTVFVGIVCYGLFTRDGMLGGLELLYTPWAIVIGDVLLALPLIFSMTHGAVKALDKRVGETARTLGARGLFLWRTQLSEARTGVVLGLLTAFARCSTELGIAVMVGANIRGYTRTLATATSLETGRGEFERGLAMGIILLVIALGVTGILAAVSREDES